MSLANPAIAALFESTTGSRAAVQGNAAPANAALALVDNTIPATRGEITLDLALRHADTHRVTVQYETVGDSTLPALFIAGGISAHRHLAPNATFAEAGWWEEQVGVGLALDPSRYHLIAFNWIGSDGSLDVPLDPADQADAIVALLDALQLKQLQAFIGCSYGSMIGLQFAARHGDRLNHLIAISGTHRPHPYSSAWRALQRQVARLGALHGDADGGLSLARQLAILSYRTPEEFGGRFDAPAIVTEGTARVAAQDYLDHCGTKYVATTPITAYLRLSESIDLHDVQPEQIRTQTTIVAVAEDRLVPIEDSRVLAKRIGPHARIRGIRSQFGHDAFLKEPEAIDAILRDALSQSAATPPVRSEK